MTRGLCVQEGKATTALEDQGEQGEANEGEVAGVGETRRGKTKRGGVMT